MNKIKESEVTPEEVYLARPRDRRIPQLTRRQFLAGAGTLDGGCGAGCLRGERAACRQPTASPDLAGTSARRQPGAGRRYVRMNWAIPSTIILTSPTTTISTNSPPTKVAWQSRRRISSPPPGRSKWSGLVNKPKTFDIDDLRKFEQEERIYRCAAWRPGRWSSPGWAFPWSRLLEGSGANLAGQVCAVSNRSMTHSRCPGRRATGTPGLM